MHSNQPRLSHLSISKSLKNFASLMAFASIAFASLSLAQAQDTKDQAIDLGDASVLSQQGQRLKIAVPFGSGPAERVPLLRFQVQSVEAGEGQSAPSARGFTISKPESRNVIFLQSAETITAPNLKLVLTIAGSPNRLVAYDIAVPPASATTPVQDTPKPIVKKGKRKTKPYGKARRSMAKKP
jgi:hypothetical protein